MDLLPELDPHGLAHPARLEALDLLTSRAIARTPVATSWEGDGRHYPEMRASGQGVGTTLGRSARNPLYVRVMSTLTDALIIRHDERGLTRRGLCRVAPERPGGNRERLLRASTSAQQHCKYEQKSDLHD